MRPNAASRLPSAPISVDEYLPRARRFRKPLLRRQVVQLRQFEWARKKRREKYCDVYSRTADRATTLDRHAKPSSNFLQHHAWNELIRGPDREVVFRAFEAATLWVVRCGLRNGSLWLAHAEQYGGQHRLLLPPARWPAARESFVERQSLPRSVDAFLERVYDQIHAGLHAVDEAVKVGDLSIHENGHITMHDDPRVTVERGDADLLRTQLYARVGRMQLPELILAIDSET